MLFVALQRRLLVPEELYSAARGMVRAASVERLARILVSQICGSATDGAGAMSRRKLKQLEAAMVALKDDEENLAVAVECGDVSNEDVGLSKRERRLLLRRASALKVATENSFLVALQDKTRRQGG